MRRGLVCVVAVATVLAIVVAPASAAPVLGDSFSVAPDVPGSLVLASDANVWVLLGNKVARVTPAGAVTKFPLPPGVNGVDITSAPDGKLWISHAAGVTRVEPATGVATQFTVAPIAAAGGIVSDTDGDLWVVDTTGGLVEVTPSGVLKQDVAVAGSNGRDIARLVSASAPSVVWVDSGGGRVFVTSTTGVATNTPTALNPPGMAQGIAASPTGFALSNPVANPQYVAVAEPTLTNVPTPLKDPTGVAYAPDEAYWFAQFNGQDLGRVDRGGASTTPITFPANSGPRQIANGSGNTLWVSLETSQKVARVNGVDPPPPPPPPPVPPAPAPLPVALPLPISLVRDVTAPTLSRLTASPSRFRVSGAKRGTKLRLTLSEAARTTFTFTRTASGRRAGGRCVRPTARLRRARSCVRRVDAGAFARALPAGASTIAFSGRLRNRPLAVGRYEVAARATDVALNRSASRKVTLTVLAPPRRR